MTLPIELRQRLLALAKQSIDYGLSHSQALPIQLEEWPQELRLPQASFVSLHIQQALRGCIGSLEAHQPLVEDISHNAFAAAFHDPRFPAVDEQDATRLDIHISILSKPEPMSMKNEKDLLCQLRPDIDGLVLEDGHKRSTFLPAVWESLPKPEEFLIHLKKKAGLAEDHWSDTIKFQRYTTEEFGS